MIGTVEFGQIADDNIDRPAIAYDMMSREHERVPVGGLLYKHGPDQGSFVQVERRTSLDRQPRLEVVRARCFWQIAQIAHVDLNIERLSDAEVFASGVNRAAQGIMPRHQLIQSGPQRSLVQRSSQV